MNTDNGKRDLSEITVGQPRPEPIVITPNADGTITLPPLGPARIYPPLMDGQLRAGIEGDRHIPRPASLLERRLQARAALEGNELLMVDGVIRVRRQR